MRKNLLALSIAAMVGGLSGVANAQAVVTDTVGGRVLSNDAASAAAFVAAKVVKAAPGDAVAGIPAAANFLTPTSTGVGHILFVPYFTTQENNMTLLNLVNTDQKNGKAVKLRFRGATNSDDLFDITVFLSPGDVWTANVMANGEISSLVSNDTSCTLPSATEIKETSGKFLVSRVRNNDAKETREGYVEILNMADIPRDMAQNSLYTAIKHVNGKAPCGQAMAMQANQLSLDPSAPEFAENSPAARGYSWATGGLSANWTIVNVNTKASFSGEAIALRATPTKTGQDVSGAANIVFSPQTTDRVTNAAGLTADPVLRFGSVRPGSYDFPDLSTPYTSGLATPEAQAGQVAEALQTFSISNEYITDPSVSFATDWVFSMPSRRYAVAMDYADGAPSGPVVFNPGVANHFTAANTSLNKDKNRLCVDTGKLVGFDREEQSRTSFVISPNDTLKFCGETSVLSFNGKPSVLGASLTLEKIPTTFTDGWMQIQTPGVGNGLPVVGYAVGKATGPDGGNFGGTWMHRTNRFVNQPF